MLAACLLLPANATGAVLPPVASNVTVDSITSSEAELSGTINPGGGQTFFGFQIRQVDDPVRDWETVESGEIGAGDTAVPVRTSANLLKPTTNYEVRLSALNTSGVETYSPSTTVFRTASPLPPSVASVRIRSARPKITRETASIIATLRISGPGRVVMWAVRNSAFAKPQCRTERRIGSAGVYRVVCRLGRKGRSRLARSPLRLTLRAAFVTDSGLKASHERELNIPRKR